MQIHVRSAFSKFVAPFCIRPLRPQHLAATKYRGSGCSDASSMSSLPPSPSLCSCPSGVYLLLRAVAKSREIRKKDVVAQLFSHDSDRPARLRSPMERSVAFVCDPRYAAKPNSRGRGADTCEYAPRRGRRDPIPGSQGRISSPRRDKDVNRWRSLERKGGSWFGRLSIGDRFLPRVSVSISRPVPRSRCSAY